MTSHDNLSDRQRNLLLFIEDYSKQHGRPPTNREIGNGLGIPSTGHVDYHLKALETKGYIRREQRTSRGIQVVNPMTKSDAIFESAGIPIMGSIAAGDPIDHYQGQHELLSSINPQHYSEKAYALRVRGESMMEDGIFDGDHVIIEPTPVARPRDIIVATNTAAGESGAATLKRFFKEGKQIRLQPANKDYNPIFVDAKDWDRNWKVQGRVAAVIRTYDNN
jgi:repressor LexA